MISRRKKALVSRLKSGRTRSDEALFLVEGVRGAEEALGAAVGVSFGVASPRLTSSERGARLFARLEELGVDMEESSDEELSELADTEAPQGVLLVCREPVFTLSTIHSVPPVPGRAPATSPGHPLPGSPGGRYLVLDGLQDPGNAGTLIRAAGAFGVDAVIALDGTVDLWNPKVVRSSAGVSFRVPLVRTDRDAWERWMEERGVRSLVADATGVDVRSLAPEEVLEPWALVIGNEGAGPRTEIVEQSFRRVSIPMPGGAESLNAGVAGAILLYDLTRRERVA